MEGTGFRGSENSGVGSGTGESDWPPNRSHHGNGHSHHGAGSFIPGAFLGAIGGAFGHSWWTSRDRAFSPPPHSYQYGYPHQPVQHHQPHMFHMPAPPPTPTRKRACSCSCCLVVLLVIGLIIAALFVPKPGSTDLELVAGDRQLKGINTKWFREVQVAGATDVDTYMFDAEPPLNDIVHLSKDIDIKLERGSFHFVRYDVHKGSTIRAQWEFTEYV
ncbi:hypothetical protein DFJ77DRAFT_154749 [Powellomyces hirtus]|nr:hypothetical protein DFJ77DRAFT_154749 [Powellomyces hirtus]